MVRNQETTRAIRAAVNPYENPATSAVAPSPMAQARLMEPANEQRPESIAIEWRGGQFSIHRPPTTTNDEFEDFVYGTLKAYIGSCDDWFTFEDCFNSSFEEDEEFLGVFFNKFGDDNSYSGTLQKLGYLLYHAVVDLRRYYVQSLNENWFTPSKLLTRSGVGIYGLFNGGELRFEMGINCYNSATAQNPEFAWLMNTVDQLIFGFNDLQPGFLNLILQLELPGVSHNSDKQLSAIGLIAMEVYEFFLWAMCKQEQEYRPTLLKRLFQKPVKIGLDSNNLPKNMSEIQEFLKDLPREKVHGILSWITMKDFVIGMAKQHHPECKLQQLFI